ncbi:MAG: ferrous iron transport protein B [Verrucomicrobia bacterium]|nr:ferrous iron transport protein B [Verrucomicrobiota bacterium]
MTDASRPTDAPEPAEPSPKANRRYVVLTGNPNCGKTTVFNALTGLRAKVGNYAGVTVERKEGRLHRAPAGRDIRVIDLPGTYSLSPQSLDEQVSRDVLMHRLPEVPPPSLVVVVIDGSNLQRNLYYATQVIELGLPTVVALNMIDVAGENGHEIDTGALSRELGVPVIPMTASRNEGVPELRAEILRRLDTAAPTPVRRFCQLSEAFDREVVRIAGLLQAEFHEPLERAKTEALLILNNDKAVASSGQRYPQMILDALAEARGHLEAAGENWRGAPIEARYQSVARIQRSVTRETRRAGATFSDRLDQVITHKVWGTLIFVAIMILMFQSIFTFASVPADWLELGVGSFGEWVGEVMPQGELHSLVVDGIIAGVGAVVVFLPQILFLFFFIGLLEDTGYMARAAFLMDRLMSKVGLHGKSFIPMLSSFACAIPGIMATRTIESPKDRLVTILIAPLMSCSARLPVYTLLIAACIPDRTVLGFFGLPALTLFAMYLLGIVGALTMGFVFKRTLLRGEPPMLILELPPYKRPLLRQVLRHMWERAKLFLRRAGTVILGVSILLWFLQTYPKNPEISSQFEQQRHEVTLQGSITDAGELDAATTQALAALDQEEAAALLAHSLAGRIGHLIEPFLAPLGFDWKIGIGIVASFAAREVFVSAMSTVYSLGGADDEAGVQRLSERLQEQTRPDGTLLYTTLTGLTLMVFYVFALQCVSTIAVVRRETNGWKWPAFQFGYMLGLAWGMAFAVRQVGLALGAG